MKNTLKKVALAFFAFGMIGTSAHAQNNETTSLSGYVIGYDSAKKSGCFFVDKQMVEQGVAAGISGKTNKSCSSAKYGLGAAINLERVPSDADYNTPAENTLLIFNGYWAVKDGINTFFVISFEPFF
ncbi:hypothetical protein [Fluviicola taffensis]|uniref:Uncharacterized protein n=1 Tax=Fluviicola taffensis (strain DSM 16823 / NCIMB 13979 / RW262) TaxID=755732 RepID=F2IFK5_FLUTR|nr:hypothetical protein [Fluviicola taffensis]AEA45719.1 hypothetical protein Fluta_3752 [Fluviicola taffensis DSM 16823]